MNLLQQAQKKIDDIREIRRSAYNDLNDSLGTMCLKHKARITLQQTQDQLYFAELDLKNLKKRICDGDIS